MTSTYTYTKRPAADTATNDSSSSKRSNADTEPRYLTPQQLRENLSRLTFAPRANQDTSKGVTIDVKLNGQPIFVKLGEWDDEGLGSLDPARRQAAQDKLVEVNTPFHYKDTMVEKNGDTKPLYDQLLKIKVDDEVTEIFEALSERYRQALFEMQAEAFPGKKVFKDVQLFRENVRFKSLIDEEENGAKFLRVKGSFNRMQSEQPATDSTGKKRWAPAPTKYYIMNANGELEEGARLQDFKVGSKVIIGVRLNGFHCSDGTGKPTLKIAMMGGIVPAGSSFAHNPEALFGKNARVTSRAAAPSAADGIGGGGADDDVSGYIPPPESDDEDAAPMDHM